MRPIEPIQPRPPRNLVGAQLPARQHRATYLLKINLATKNPVNNMPKGLDSANCHAEKGPGLSFHGCRGFTVGIASPLKRGVHGNRPGHPC